MGLTWDYVDSVDLVKDFVTKCTEYTTCCSAPIKKKYMITPNPTKIIRNGPATIIFWDDGTKTLVKRKEDCADDPYLAFCAALAKKIYGNNSRVKKLIETKTVVPKERKRK